ncbi:MAG: HRDC domain-containing protein [Treponema sp.]
MYLAGQLYTYGFVLLHSYQKYSIKVRKLSVIEKRRVEQAGIPVYAVVTNARFAQIAEKKPQTITVLVQVEGTGQGKCETLLSTCTSVYNYSMTSFLQKSGKQRRRSMSFIIENDLFRVIKY